MGHATTLCLINAGCRANEHASALMKIKRLSLIMSEVENSFNRHAVFL